MMPFFFVGINTIPRGVMTTLLCTSLGASEVLWLGGGGAHTYGTSNRVITVVVQTSSYNTDVEYFTRRWIGAFLEMGIRNR